MLHIHNTLSHKKELFSPRIPGKVSLYVCGMTVYDHCHLGHARSAVIFDVIRNYLEYKGFEVHYVKNHTDVDDKIIARAQREGRDWREIANAFIAAYDRDMARLGVRPPTVSPKATDHIPEIIQLIERLVLKGVAYAIEGDVYFDVGAFSPYGKLSHRKTDDLISGARVEVDPRKKNPFDFALWKSSKPDEPAWKSPWGMGRPGWHIECSAMAMKHLGNTIDLHGGGEDLVFPHHENEIAQSEAASGKPFVSCWIHHGFVTIDDEKMSKSLGNFFTIDEIFKKLSRFPDPVISEVLRYYLLSKHYRSPIDFSDQGLASAKSGLDNFYTLFQKIDETFGDVLKNNFEKESESEKNGFEKFQVDFEIAMDDDFNTAKAIGLLQECRFEVDRALREGKQKYVAAGMCLLKSLGKHLGILQLNHTNWRYHAEATFSIPLGSTPNHLGETEIQSLIAEREVARREKEWAESDQIRDRLKAAGIILEDRPDGSTRVKR